MNKLVSSTLTWGVCTGVYGLGIGTIAELGPFTKYGEYDKKLPLFVGSTGFVIGSYLGLFIFNPLLGAGVSGCSLIGVNMYMNNNKKMNKIKKE